MRCGPLNIKANETLHTLLNFSEYSAKPHLELSVLGAIRAPGIHPKWLRVPLSPLKAAAGAFKSLLLHQDSNPNTCLANLHNLFDKQRPLGLESTYSSGNQGLMHLFRKGSAY